MDRTKILDRVRKLLAIAEDPRANPHEAVAAAHQASTIMRKFELEHSDILLREAASGTAEFGTTEVTAFMKRNTAPGHTATRVPLWAGWLAVRVAKLNDCECRIIHRPQVGAVVQFCGYAADVQVSGWMYEYLMNAMIAAVRAWQRAATRSKLASNSYREGFVRALCASLRDYDAERRAPAAHSTSRALVVAKAGAVAQHFGDFTYGKRRGNSNVEGNAYSAGSTAGAAVDVRRGALNGASSKTLRIA